MWYVYQQSVQPQSDTIDAEAKDTTVNWGKIKPTSLSPNHTVSSVLQTCQFGIQTNNGAFTYILYLSTVPLLSDPFPTLPLLWNYISQTPLLSCSQLCLANEKIMGAKMSRQKDGFGARLAPVWSPLVNPTWPLKLSQFLTFFLWKPFLIHLLSCLL